MERQNVLALIAAYYLSKFDREAYQNLGYDTHKEAHQSIGKKLGVNPNSVKNMRDEFDAIHDNGRVGWYQRALRPSRKKVVEAFQDLSEAELREIIITILYDHSLADSDDLESVVKIIEKTENVKEANIQVCWNVSNNELRLK